MTDQPSSSEFIQASRVLKVKSPLGEDQLLPERMVISEGVSQLFEIQLNVRAKKEAVKPEELIGRLVDVSIEVQQGDGEEGSGIRRPFNGLVTDLHEGPPITRGLRSYAMTIRPQMWLLSRRSDCRIWLDKTSMDVVETLFSEHGIPAPDTSGIIQPPPPQIYSVQFNETDLDYLLRRFEEDGLYYFFSHEDGSHKLHVADTANGWLGPSPSAQGEGKVRLAQGSSDRNHINDWARRFSYVSGQRAGADWNFETPGMVPGNMTPSLVQMPDATKRELYEYPARIKTVEEAERAQKLRAQSIEADHDRVFGGSTSRILEAGRRFTPYEVAHPEHEYEEHVIIKASHTVVDRSYETNSNEPEYRNAFEAIPARVPLTPHRTTKRPKIEGTQVAIVAGPEGEEIHPDQYGRIKLWFPWDRNAKKDGTDTCWVRVAQNWAGSTWGGQIIPRIGMEVMVAFVDGDPDRPLVTGVVPNARQTVPYELPANKTRSTFRTNTHKGAGFNELTFEDEAGQENMFFHAQKNQTTRVLNDQIARVDNHEVRSVGGSRTLEIAANQKHDIGGSYHLTVGGVGAASRWQAMRHQQMANVSARMLEEASQNAGRSAEIMPFSKALAGLSLGYIDGQALTSRASLVSGNSAREDAGTLMAKSASQVGDAVNGLFDQTGVMNTVAANFRSETVGLASVEQIGVTKVTNVGKTWNTNVGKKSVATIGESQETHVGKSKSIYVGEEFTIEVGKKFSVKVGDNHLVIDSSGNIAITAAKTTITKGGGAQFSIGPGPILYSPVLVQGKTPAPGAPAVPRKTRKPFAEECQYNPTK